MELNGLSNIDLITSLKRLVKAERKVTHMVLLHINEVEDRRLHLEMGYDRMYSYLTKGLGYSEYSAYERIRAAELLRKIPEVSERIESGALNLTQITEVQKCLRQKADEGEEISHDKVKEALSIIEFQNGFNTRKYLAQEFDLPLAKMESAKPQKDESVRLEITLSKEEFVELQRAKEFLSSVCPDGKWSNVISTLARKFNQTKTGRQKMEKTSACINEDIKSTKSTHSLMVSPKSYRPYISIKTKRQIFTKASFQCEYEDSRTGHRCHSKYQLQVDHRIPLARSGGHELENLRILCAFHNRHEAVKWGLSHPPK